jgi:hypothetical protein
VVVAMSVLPNLWSEAEGHRSRHPIRPRASRDPRPSSLAEPAADVLTIKMARAGLAPTL